MTITTIHIMNLAADIDATARAHEASLFEHGSGVNRKRKVAALAAAAEQAVETLEATLATFAAQLIARANAAGAAGPAKAITSYLDARAEANEANYDVRPPTGEMRAALVELTGHRVRHQPKRPGGNPYTPHYLSGFEVGEIESGS